LNEAELIRLAQNGDEQAFAMLMEQNRAALAGTAYLMLRNAQLAEDAVQEALVQIWQGLPSYRPIGSFRGWVVTVLVRKVQKLQRKHRVDTVPLDGMEDRLEYGKDVEEEVFLGDRRDQVRRALSLVNPEHREVLILRFYSELSVPEIARTLGTPEGTVKSRLSRALDRLGSVLKQAGVGEATARTDLTKTSRLSWSRRFVSYSRRKWP
jgi:RNA polymerase sigma-70 factor (ECF subfamily)